MVTHAVREKLYRLDEIYKFHRKDKNNYAGKIIYACINEYMEYWRQLEDRNFDGLRKHERDELYFFFNEKLHEIARAHLDMYWLIYDYDDQPLYRNGDEPEPFWQEDRRRAARKRRIRMRAEIKT
jgi:hypothetical protein